MPAFLRRHSLSIAFLAALSASIILFLGAADDIQQLNGYTMGTTYQLQIVELPGELSRQEISDAVTALLMDLDVAKFSTYAPDSELSRFNRYPVDQPFSASVEFIAVLTLAQEVAALTDGAFDVTIGALVNLWGFGPSMQLLAEDIPDQQRIDALMQSVGYEYLQIDAANSTVTKLAEVYVDLSGIAKGYAVDQLAAYFDRAGVENYFLEVGGELKIKGEKPGNQSWVPAIETPQDTESQVYEIFFSNGAHIAVAGSGDYRNYFEVDGVRYSHEIDPRTGRPVSHNLAAAYVIDASAAKADALATAYMVLGLDAARELAERTGQAAYFIFTVAGVGFGDYVTEEFSIYLRSD